MPRVGFQPTISAVERSKTYALDRAATGTGSDSSIVSMKYFMFIYFNRTSPHSLITHPPPKQCHLLSIVGGPFFKFTTF